MNHIASDDLHWERKQIRGGKLDSPDNPIGVDLKGRHAYLSGLLEGGDGIDPNRVAKERIIDDRMLAYQHHISGFSNSTFQGLIIGRIFRALREQYIKADDPGSPLVEREFDIRITAPRLGEPEGV